MNILAIVGARPNFMKVAPLYRAFEATQGRLRTRIVHTGQHYDAKMSDVFFEQLEMPHPHVYLGIGGGTHAQQTAKVMMAFEEVVLAERPDLVLVVGDVNSTLACSVVASKLHVPVAHVEAGLRSFDRRMPEEINRLLTDRISDLLFVTEQSGLDHLAAEGIEPEKVFFTGNVMIDSLVHFRPKAAATRAFEAMDLPDKGYLMMTMHRPSNVDTAEGLAEIVTLVEQLAARMPVVFPVHPRTRGGLRSAGLDARLDALSNVHVVDPIGYLEFLNLMEHAAALVTDSGGIQEETTYLGVPCLTLRETTERPVTVTLGTNELLPLDAPVVAARVDDILAGRYKTGTTPPLWDGQAATRIADVLCGWGGA